MSDIKIPVIDLTPFTSGKGTEEEKQVVIQQIGDACANVGFLTVIGHGIETEIVDNIWKSTQDFFNLPDDEKKKYCMPQEVYPFGYSPIGEEVLAAGKSAEHGNDDEGTISAPPDIKEMFSLGPSDPASGLPPRIFPSNPESFEASWTNYYNALTKLASHILTAFAASLELPLDFFDAFTTHHASALRAINYPAIASRDAILPNQCRASAHTDYGTITILRADGPGLQVSKDSTEPVWVDVPHIPGAFIINLGDLMRRWTNDRWLSTLHRVVIPETDLTENGTSVVCRRRQSLAFFHNVNRDAIVEVIRRSDDEVPLHEPIQAGEFLTRKHLASVGIKTAK